MATETNRLATIVQRQRSGRARDLVFACFLALAAVIGATTIGSALTAPVTNVADR